SRVSSDDSGRATIFKKNHRLRPTQKVPELFIFGGRQREKARSSGCKKIKCRMRNSAPTGSRGSVGFPGFTVCTKNLQRFVAAGYSASPAYGDHQSRTFSVKKARCGAVETGKALVRLRANPLDN